LAIFGSAPSVIRLLSLYLLGYFCNTLLPSHVGGDVVRTLAVSNDGAGYKASFLSTIFERFSGLVAMVALAILSLIFVGELPTGVTYAVLVIAFIICLILILCTAPVRSRIILLVDTLSWLPPVISSNTKLLLKEMAIITDNKSVLVRIMLLSFLFHAFSAINTLVAAWAVGWTTVSLPMLFGVLPLILLVGAMPLTPSGIGIQEGAFVYFLGLIGATTEEALSIALVLRAKVLFLALLGGVVWFLQRPKLAQKIT
jgi:uncharacterized protein (TIRG00374 family)